MKDWRPSLPQTARTFYAISGHQQPFLPLFCSLFGLDSSPGLASACTRLKGRAGGAWWREDKEEAATGVSQQQKGMEKVVSGLEATDALLHATAARRYHSSSPPASPHAPPPRILVLSRTLGDTSSANQSTPECSFPPPPSCSSTKHTRSEASGACKGQDEDTCSCSDTPQGSRRSQISPPTPLLSKYLHNYQRSINNL